MIRIHEKKQQILNPRHLEILEIVFEFTDGCTTTQILKLMNNPPTDRTLRSDMVQLEQQKQVRQGEGRASIWMLNK